MSDISFPIDALIIVPWTDPVLDQEGHDPRSEYVERFWTSVLGPSTVLLVRRLVHGFEAAPNGYRIWLPDAAQALGLATANGKGSPFYRALTRSVQFNCTRLVGERLYVHTKLPTVGPRALARMPAELQAEHQAFVEAARATSAADVEHRARELALSLYEMGEGPSATEAQLEQWRFPRPVVRDAATWAWMEYHRRLDEHGVSEPLDAA
jgi:hypothetical protein